MSKKTRPRSILAADADNQKMVQIDGRTSGDRPPLPCLNNRRKIRLPDAELCRASSEQNDTNHENTPHRTTVWAVRAGRTFCMNGGTDKLHQLFTILRRLAPSNPIAPAAKIARLAGSGTAELAVRPTSKSDCRLESAVNVPLLLNAAMLPPL